MFNSGQLHAHVVKIISALHRRFAKIFTPALLLSLSTALSPPSRVALSAMAPEQREKEDSARVSRQRPVLRVCSELALVGIIRDAPGRSGGEWVMKGLRELASPHQIWLHAVETEHYPIAV